MLRRRRSLSYRIVYRRTFDNYRRFLVARKVCNRGLIDPASCIDVDCIYNLRTGLALSSGRMLGLILSSWREQKTSVGCESQSAKKRRQSLICVEVCIPDPEA